MRNSSRIRKPSPLNRPAAGLTPIRKRTSSYSTPRFVASDALSAVGGWVLSPTSSTPTMTMSRSSSGPGITAQGSFIRFGDQEPINIDEAQMRATIQRENLRRRQNGEIVQGDDDIVLPYPVDSVMPRTEGEVREVMAEQAREGMRSRGVSNVSTRPNLGLNVIVDGVDFVGMDSAMLTPPLEDGDTRRR